MTDYDALVKEARGDSIRTMGDAQLIWKLAEAIESLRPDAEAFRAIQREKLSVGWMPDSKMWDVWRAESPVDDLLPGPDLLTAVQAAQEKQDG